MADKIRAVIYCRVSTGSDAQMESLDKQIFEAEEAVKGLGYELVERFIDGGKTGTTKEARKEYLRMLSQIEEDKFDVIVTKSLDRMNRNILDFYLFLDLVVRNGVRLYFYLDRDFYKADDKIVIGIKAILAEEYSRELSKKLCSAHARRQERGEVVMLSSQTYGYRKELQADGRRQVVIQEEEAEMIHLIFDYCREGYGARAIAGFLYEKGYVNRNNNPIGESTIRRIIRNPLVTGTMIMNKEKSDFNSKTKLRMDPSQWILKENAVPPIISRAVWQEANDKMNSRMNIASKKSGIYKGIYHFSGKISCGLCGSPYYHGTGTGENKTKGRWCCSRYMKFGCGKRGCLGPPLKEGYLYKVIGAVAWEQLFLPGEQKEIWELTLTALSEVVFEETVEEREKIMENRFRVAASRRRLLLEKYISGIIEESTYLKMDESLEAEEKQTEKELFILKTKEAVKDNDREKRSNLITDFLKEEGLYQAAACMLLEYLEGIFVYEDYLELRFKDEISTDAEKGGPGSKKRKVMRISPEAYPVKNREKALRRTENKICDLISQNPRITLSEMATELGIGKRGLSDRMAALKSRGVISVSGRGRGTIWSVVKKIPE